MWSNLDVIGWYSSKSAAGKDSDTPTEQDITLLNGAMRELCENPLFLIMNTNS
jgi:hypothetical protein